MVHGKSNLAPAGAALAYKLDPVDGFSWQGEYDITLEELLSGKKGKSKPESQFTKACRLLEAELALHPVPAVEIIEVAEEQGISYKTLKRAKSDLGVISIRRNAQWLWELPVEAQCTECYDINEETQGGQEGHVPALASLTPLALLPGGTEG
jgi:hypothetical protein